MPIDEYAWHDCQHEFEVLVRGRDTSACPTCQGSRLVKLVRVAVSEGLDVVGQKRKTA